jgi:glyoxalase/bleomycin resistance protein/dioxygenase superfamily protein
MMVPHLWEKSLTYADMISLIRFHRTVVSQRCFRASLTTGIDACWEQGLSSSTETFSPLTRQSSNVKEVLQNSRDVWMIKKANATIYVSDVESALRFYTDVLGMKVKSHWGKDFAELETNGLTIGLHPATQSGPKPGTSGSISIGLEVDDLDSSVGQELCNQFRLRQGELLHLDSQALFDGRC